MWTVRATLSWPHRCAPLDALEAHLRDIWLPLMALRPRLAAAPPLPLLLLLLAGAARAAVVARFSDASCTVPTRTTKIFGGKCYGSSLQHGAGAAGWLAFVGRAPIAESWAVTSCVAGSISVARWDTPSGATDFCLGAPTSSVTYALNVCTPDALNAGDTGGAYAMLVDDTCRMSSDAPFFVANMYYSQFCSQLSFIFRSTYMTFDAGACELVAIPQFADGTTSKRAVVTNSECASGATAQPRARARARGRVALTDAPRSPARVCVQAPQAAALP